MQCYPKIETLFERDETTYKVIKVIRLPEFENIKNWLITEKIDGTNIRVIYQPPETIIFKGRTDNAQMPTYLLKVLQKMFTVEKFKKVLDKEPKQGICLYGEGYGQKIQKGGGNYNPGNSFRLFDIWIDGWWLEWDKVCEIAEMMEIRTVPIWGKYNLNEAIKLISDTINQPITSILAREEADKTKQIEGIVARTYPTILFRNGTPIKWKLKYSDFS